MATADGGARRTGVRSTLGAVLAGLAAVVVWWFQGTDESPAPEDSSSVAASTGVTPTPTPAQTSSPAQRPQQTSAPQDRVDEHGLVWVDASSLPDPAGEILVAIDNGGPFEYAPKDGSTFGNYEGVLPQQRRGYYREYTVETPGLDHRGARRIVTGAGGEFYWTDDHYSSFERIRR